MRFVGKATLAGMRRVLAWSHPSLMAERFEGKNKNSEEFSAWMGRHFTLGCMTSACCCHVCSTARPTWTSEKLNLWIYVCQWQAFLLAFHKCDSPSAASQWMLDVSHGWRWHYFYFFSLYVFVPFFLLGNMYTICACGHAHACIWELGEHTVYSLVLSPLARLSKPWAICILYIPIYVHIHFPRNLYIAFCAALQRSFLVYHFRVWNLNSRIYLYVLLIIT